MAKESHRIENFRPSRRYRPSQASNSAAILIAFGCVGVLVSALYIFYNHGVDIGEGFQEVSKPSYDDFERIESGMTFEECRDILGPRYEVTSQAELLGSKGVAYTWYQQFGDGKCMVTFTNNRAILKVQEDLK